VGEVTPIKYRAFISSGKGDAAWAEELQRALEAAQAPASLIGRETALGPVPKDLKPIFRTSGEDSIEGQPLSEKAAAALAESSVLVLLGSPEAAKSAHVNEAVRRFKSSGKGAQIIPLIIAGEPKHEENECFPPALRFKLAADATVLSEPEDPVAPLVIDARTQGDGKDRATLKLIAALFGLDLDAYQQSLAPAVAPAGEQAAVGQAGEQALDQAEKPAGKPRPRKRVRLVAALLALALLAGAGAWLRFELPRDDKLLDGTLDAGTTAALSVVEAVDRFGLPRAWSLDLAETSETTLRAVADWGADTPRLRHRRAMMRLAFARREEALGRLEARPQRMAEAAALLTAIKSQDLGNPALEREIAMAQLAFGNALLARGAPEEALKPLRPSLAVMERRAAADPGDVERQRELALVGNAVGDALLAKGAIDEASQRYRDALAVRERLASLDPRNEIFRRDLSVSHERIGDVLFTRGDFVDALKAYRTSLALRLGAVDSEASGGWQRQLSVSYNKIGDVMVARGAPEDALNSYRTGLALQLGAANRDNAARRDLSVSYERIGDVLRSQRAFEEALAAYSASLSIRERLAAGDPGNPRWQRDLPISHERIGDALVGRGALEEGLAAYRASLAMRERLAAADPDSIAAQADVAVSHNKIGDALAANGALDDAVKSFRAALAIRERLVALDSTNPQWQWDLLVLQWRLASSGDDPARRFGLIVSTMRDLAARRKLTVEQARWLPAAEQELAKLEGH
jgi:tetratricopeptide (TPR) repeat protein